MQFKCRVKEKVIKMTIKKQVSLGKYLMKQIYSRCVYIKARTFRFFLQSAQVKKGLEPKSPLSILSPMSLPGVNPIFSHCSEFGAGPGHNRNRFTKAGMMGWLADGSGVFMTVEGEAVGCSCQSRTHTNSQSQTS